MDPNNLFKRAEQYVTRLYQEHNDPRLHYHNLQHTRYVVGKASQIAAHYQLSEKETLIIYLAAWFHDTGFLIGDPEGHEENSVELLRSFAKEYSLEEEVLTEAEGCIMATRSPREPKNLLQEIICDADTFNLGTKDFKESNNNVFREIQALGKEQVTREGFNLSTSKLLEEHTYFTSYCRDLLNLRKMKNQKKAKKKVDKIMNEPNLVITEQMGTRKGMQTMLRLTSQNHIQLSEMADNKANILISVNAIIISVILTVLLRRLPTDPHLVIPTAIFLISSVSTIIIAILATRPKVSSGVFDDVDITNKKTNLLFFGNFHKVPYEKYDRAMRSMMNDSDYLYSSIIQDIYYLGSVLGKKYKLTRLAYNIFMTGIIISVIAFGLAVMLHEAGGAAPATNSKGSPF